MLGKLIKYDFRSCWRKFWSVWITIILLSIINAWSWVYCEEHINNTFIVNTLPKMVIFAFVVAAVVLTLSYIYEEFAHGLLGRQGYLMFTLPVSGEELIISKGTVAVILEALSVASVEMSLVVVLCIIEPISFSKFVRDFFVMIIENNAVGIMVLLVLVLFILLIMTLITFNLHFYTAAAIGHLSYRYRKAFFVIIFIALCVLSMYILIYVGIPIIKGISCSLDAGCEQWTLKNDIKLTVLCGGAIIFVEAIYSTILFSITAKILKTHLNLE